MVKPKEESNPALAETARNIPTRMATKLFRERVMILGKELLKILVISSVSKVKIASDEKLIILSPSFLIILFHKFQKGDNKGIRVNFPT